MVCKDSFKSEHKILSRAPEVAGSHEGRKLRFLLVLSGAAQRTADDVTINIPKNGTGFWFPEENVYYTKNK